jgi:hypothetical protein
METFAAVIAAFPDGALADRLGVKRGLVALWKHRNTIPPEHWAGVVAAATADGIDGVTLEKLAEIAARRRKAA